MSVIAARPPNFDQILAAFPNADQPGVIFAYGEHVYNPTGNEIPPALVAHEAVHQKRQLALGQTFTPAHMGPGIWWARYLEDAKFRYHEELLAHVAEFKAQEFRSMDRNVRAKLLQSTALRLVAPLYNYQPPRSLGEAMRDLRWEMEQK